MSSGIGHRYGRLPRRSRHPENKNATEESPWRFALRRLVASAPAAYYCGFAQSVRPKNVSVRSHAICDHTGSNCVPEMRPGPTAVSFANA